MKLTTTRALVVAAAAASLYTVIGAQQQLALPAPFATPSTRNQSSLVPKPDGVNLTVPAGFSISVFADNMPQARMMVWAPNGDLFVAQSRAGTITVMRGGSPDRGSGIGDQGIGDQGIEDRGSGIRGSGIGDRGSVQKTH